jgi:hypothetical protein
MNDSKEDELLCQKFAQQWRVIPVIHPMDYLFQFVIHLPLYQSNREQAIAYYFSDGFASAENLRLILEGICGIRNRACTLLEFASGYGCVTRHLQNVLPAVKVTSCDIHPEAITFLQNEFGVDAMQSHAVPEQVSTDKRFDVVFALSFFSHMPKTTFSRWLKTLSSLVVPGGFLVFTTHGLTSKRLHIKNTEFDKDGFFFLSSSEQKDINPSEYGCAVVQPLFVLHAAKQVGELSLTYFREAHWWGHQDLYVFQKTASPDTGVNHLAAAKNLKTGFFSKLSYWSRKLHMQK